MAVDRQAATLARVAEIRGTRLARAAGETRAAADETAAAAERARMQRAAAATARDEARQAFVATPTCSQARLWLDRTIALEAGATADMADRAARAELAREAHDAALAAVGRHQVRSDTIANHHRALLRTEARRAEDHVEAEAPMPLGTRIL
ncbi:MAG: hypothetical protein J7500_11820 [Sphingomonas sp.]|uniref:hypothetical protein n=1 Tax=Sphingomonas sp. TaxID=28214 RepID=UPI001B29928F|nr:hypothetical protein [Sphingomonas sp.]MBO9623387.1 hypothetical protein [Sphingomonas sp.]